MKTANSILALVFTALSLIGYSQNNSIEGIITGNKKLIEFATVQLQGTAFGSITNKEGKYTLTNIPSGEYTLRTSYVGYMAQSKKITIEENKKYTFNFSLKENTLDEFVVTGTMKPVSKLQSPVPVEVYSPVFFQSNPTPSVYESMANINGVRPQINCAVCNTGDIHINGLEGAYTMVLIDGMPIVSGLSTVYGLSGIPQSLIERVEVVKGPASTLYGSEAVGGLINVITKSPINTPLVSGEAFVSSWGEINKDIATKFNIGKKIRSLIGINYFNFSNRIDKNNDSITDLTLQDRISLFNKWNIIRKDNKQFSIAARYVFEDRFGGELDWIEEEHRGGTEIYGESIYTNRWEAFGTYELPVKEKILFQFSANSHQQNSVYGDMEYIGDQRIGFGQFTWDKKVGDVHDLLIGTALRYTYYDDNTTATELNGINSPTNTYLPGIFIQDEISVDERNKLLLGMRYDYNSLHGNICTPRINYKWNSENELNILRFSFGTGYRVANVFTEDHAALTGARDVIFEGDLNPETSLNGNINFVKKLYNENGLSLTLDATAFYTHFYNKIFADYDTDPDQIIYANIDGHAVSNGASLNINLNYNNFKMNVGATVMEVYSINNGIKERQELTEQYTGTWTLGYNFFKQGITLDYTGNLYGPMPLPTLGENDPRPSDSPWWSIQNIQMTKKIGSSFEVFGGIKNLLDWTPWKNMPEGIEMMARPFDPFDKEVTFNNDGEALMTANNPLGLTFDPAYVYGPNQGRRAFFGIRYTID